MNPEQPKPPYTNFFLPAESRVLYIHGVPVVCTHALRVTLQEGVSFAQEHQLLAKEARAIRLVQEE